MVNNLLQTALFRATHSKNIFMVCIHSIIIAHYPIACKEGTIRNIEKHTLKDGDMRVQM